MQANRLLRWTLTAGLIAGTTAFVPLNEIGFNAPKLALASIAVVTGISLLLWKNNLNGLRHLLTQPSGTVLICFFTFILLSPLWSTAPLLSVLGNAPRFEGMLSYGCFFGFFLMAFECAKTDKVGVRWIEHSLAFVGALLALYGVLQWLCQGHLRWGSVMLPCLDPWALHWQSASFLGRIFSFVGQPNALAQAMVITLPFLTLAAWSQTGLKRYAITLGALCAVFALAASASRAGLAGGLTMVLIWLACVIAHHNHFRAQWRQWLGPGLLAAGSIAVLTYSMLQARFSHPLEQGRSLGARAIIASSVSGLIVKNPLGYGLETLALNSASVLPKELYRFEALTTEIDRAHSKPLDLLYSLGWAGGLLYYAWLVLLLKQLWRHRSHTVCATCGLALAGISVTLVLDFESIPVHLLFWTTAGLGSASVASLTHTGSTNEKTIISRIILWFTLFSTVLAAITSLGWIRARFMMAAAEETYRIGATEAALAGYRRAVTAFPFDRTILINTAETALVLAEQEPSKIQTLAPQVEHWIAILATLTHHRDGTADLLLGWLAAANAEPAVADALFRRALIKMPISLAVHRITLHGYELLGDEAGKHRAATALIAILPPEWSNPTSQRGRILWKENPWLAELLSFLPPSVPTGSHRTETLPVHAN